MFHLLKNGKMVCCTKTEITRAEWVNKTVTVYTNNKYL